MMHALVPMATIGTKPADDELQAKHERFIDDLDQANKVVLQQERSVKPPVPCRAAG